VVTDIQARLFFSGSLHKLTCIPVCDSKTSGSFNQVFFNIFFETELFSALLIAHGIHGLRHGSGKGLRSRAERFRAAQFRAAQFRAARFSAAAALKRAAPN